MMTSSNTFNNLLVDTKTPRCNRAKLDTGTFCNYDCEFCYYKDQLHIRTPLEEVKRRADYLLQYGITQVDLSGGESAISPDWFSILDYCNSRFEHISCISHGGKFADIEFLRESQQRGLKEVMFSLHGSTSAVHDSITNRKGSFERIINAIHNAKKLGLIVRINCTVYAKNCGQLSSQFADLVNDIDPLEVNFITLNYWGCASSMRNTAYHNMTDAIKQCIDRLDTDIINVRYVPYCYMKGYEQYVCNQYQHVYDMYDWNKEIYSGLLDVSIPYTNEQKLMLAYKECERQRKQFYHKDVKCYACKYDYICDGVEKQIRGTELFPEKGQKIIDVNHYRKEHFK